MKRSFCVPLALGLSMTAAALAAGEPAKTEQASKDPSHEEIMAAYMKYASPGEPHNVLKAMAGSWRMTTKSWEGPGEPEVSQGECEATLILGDRYLKEECTGKVGEMDYKGLGITGYDNMKNKYVSMWVDTMGTGIMVSEGAMDPTKKLITYRTRIQNPLTRKMDPARMVMKLIDDGSHTFTMYEMHEGKETKTMEVTYTRK